MGRRNQRDRITPAPLDLTPHEVNAAKPSRNLPRDQVDRIRQERAKRQRDARVNGGIDWSACLVPTCGNPVGNFGAIPKKDRDHTLRLPLCSEHAVVVHQQVANNHTEPLLVEASTRLLAYKEAQATAAAEEAKRARLARTDGHLYFIRLNGLIKAGWSRTVDERLHSYGPDVEVLCIYPGTRDDETNLHRQLAPVRARGREWYEDGKVIADYVARVIAEHGEPNYRSGWSTPKEVIRPRRRAS